MILYLLWLLPLQAEPVAYDLDLAQSRVEFTYQFGEDSVTGQFPDFAVDLLLDFDDVPNSSVTAVLQTGSVKGGFVFATQALRGPQVLDVEQFPDIRFRSEKILVRGTDIIVDGQITVRGIQLPITMTVRLFRATGSLPTERDDLTLVMTGQIDRNDFEASGFPDFVGPILEITITAKINRRS